jgi:hypothetical protein
MRTPCQSRGLLDHLRQDGVAVELKGDRRARNHVYVKSMTTWQIASGDSGRDFSELCIAHDVMMLGPGDPGPYDGATYRALVSRGTLSAGKANSIGRFRHDVNPGDYILLRKGHRVVSMGVVADDGYEWDPRFDDVLGWDLNHTRRVIWQDQLEPELHARQQSGSLFGARKQIPMFTKVSDEQVLAPIRNLFSQAESRELKPLPPEPTAVLTDDELGRELFSMGLSNRATDDVLAALNRQRRLEDWYDQHGSSSSRPSENEVVAHMVLPLLLALGWSEQLLGVEWNRVDLAGFSGAPTTADKCSLVCEAKGQGHGLSGVLHQARGYIEKLRLKGCDRILLTEGGRHYLYQKIGEDWATRPTAYLSARRPRLRYLDGTSAIDALMSLRHR